MAHLPPSSPYPSALSTTLLMYTLRFYTALTSYGLYSHIATGASDFYPPFLPTLHPTSRPVSLLTKVLSIWCLDNFVYTGHPSLKHGLSAQQIRVRRVRRTKYSGAKYVLQVGDGRAESISQSSTLSLPCLLPPSSGNNSDTQYVHS